MKLYSHILAFGAAITFSMLLMAGNTANARGERDMVFEGMSGDVLAAVLYAKHYSATHYSELEVIDITKAVPPLELHSNRSASRGIRKASLPAILGLIMGLSEMLLSIFKRSGKNAVSKDRHSLGLIWLVNLTAIAAGFVTAYKLYWCRLPWPETWITASCWLFAVGTALRWYSILYLGRFFTTNVAIAADHRVVDTGPYRFVRHPSYAGAMLAVLGLSLSFHNWASAIIIFIPCFAVNQWRIRIEEKVLAEALGKTYLNYMQKTRRLIPFIF